MALNCFFVVFFFGIVVVELHIFKLSAVFFIFFIVSFEATLLSLLLSLLLCFQAAAKRRNISVLPFELHPPHLPCRSWSRQPWRDLCGCHYRRTLLGPLNNGGRRVFFCFCLILKAIALRTLFVLSLFLFFSSLFPKFTPKETEVSPNYLL